MKDVCLRLYHKGKSGFRSFCRMFTASEWIFLVFPFAIGTTFIVGVGPEFQRFALSVLNAGAPSFYDAAFKNGIPEIPDLGTWLLSCAHPVYIAIGFITSIVALRRRVLKEVLLWVALSLWFTYSVLDTVYVLFERPIDIGWIFLNLGSNLVGGVMLAFIAAWMFIAFRLLSSISTSPVVSRILGAASLILSGVLASSAIHFVVEMVYNPLPVSIEYETGGDLRGYYSNYPIVKRGKETKFDNFSWIPTANNREPIVVEPFEDSTTLQWNRQGSDAKYRVEFFAFADCLPGKLKVSGRGLPYLVVEDVKQMTLPVIPGPQALRIVPTKNISAKQYGVGSGFFWVNPHKETIKSGKVAQDVTLWSGGNRGLKVSASDDIDLILRPAVVDFGRERISWADRNLEIVVDGKPYRHRITTNKTPKVDEKLRCRSVSPERRQEGSRGGTSLFMPGTVLMFDIWIRVHRTSFDPFVMRQYDQVLDVRPMMGNIIAEKVGLTDIGEFEKGPSRIALQSSTGQVKVDGVASSLGPMDRLDLMGRLETFLLGDKTVVRGSADAAWINQKRLNKTRWEMLSSEWQLWIIGATVTAIAAVIGFGRKSIAVVLNEDIPNWV